MIKKIILSMILGMLVCINGMATASSERNDKGPVINSLNLHEASMKDVCRLLSASCNRPIIVSDDAADVKVSIFLEKVRCMDALSAICRAHGLWYRHLKDNGIYHVQTIGELKDTLKIYNDQIAESVTILYPAVEDIGNAIQELFIDRVIWTPPDEEAGDAYNSIERALKRMDLMNERGIFDFSNPEGGGSESDSDDDSDSGDHDDSDSGSPKRSSSRILGLDDSFGKAKDGKNKRSMSHNQRRVMNNLYAVQDLQDALKLDKLSALHRLTGQPGLVYMSALPSSNTLLLRSSDPAALKQIKELIAKLDKPSPQVLLEVKVLSVRLDDNNARGIDFLFDKGHFSGGFANGIPSANSGNLILPSAADLVPQGTGVDSKAAILNIVSNHVKFRLQMLEEQGRLTRLATPNLLVADNEASRLFVGTETTVMEKAEARTTYIPVSNGQSYLPDTSWEIEAPRRDIGISLIITPRIHADRTVTIRLLQEHSKLGQERKNVYSGGASGVQQTGADALLSQSAEDRYFISQDIDQQSITTTVHAKDGNLVVIGGLIEEQLEKTINAMPVLSDIPYIGDLFSQDKENRLRNEIMVVIRPFVLVAPKRYQDVTHRFLERLSQHPSAHGDIPAMGVSFDWELAKPFQFNPSDPFLKRMKDRLRTWTVDTKTPGRIYEELRKEKKLTKQLDADHEVEKINNYFDKNRHRKSELLFENIN